MTKQVHYDTIIAWANGEKIQSRYPGASTTWIDTNFPVFYDHYEYRVKPKEKTPGQKCFEGFYTAAERSGSTTWEQSLDYIKEWWEAAAAAVNV